jgi:hypothetical protein
LQTKEITFQRRGTGGHQWNHPHPNRQLTVTEYYEELIVLTRGLSHCGLAIYIKKYLKAKEEL